MSTLFPHTLREDPAGAESPGHRLLIRAGYVRRVAPGIYTWLPLGYRVLRNVERIVREEMEAIGSQEVHFPALAPGELFAASGRLAMYGDLLFRLTDRKSVSYVLGPTHEELFTTLVRDELSSYKDYPLALFQIQTKYRDEARPRAGVLRGREFLMKDGYTFDLDEAGFERAYERHRAAYIRIFERIGLDFRVVAAMSGAMGGTASEEFLAPSADGEDTFVHCASCGYAANTEAVRIAVPPARDGRAEPPIDILATPDTPTIDSLVARLRELYPDRDLGAADTLKNVVLKTRQPGATEWELLIVGVPGDREVDLVRVAGALDPVEVAPADAADLAAQPALVKGYIGPQGLPDIRYVVDPLVAPGTSWVTGANVIDRHAANVVRGRDFEPAGEIGAAALRDDDRCVSCGQPLSIARGIEVGHIFDLGRRFSDTFGLDALGPDGKPVGIAMGCYGLGVSRVVGALAEQSHDENGLIWPREVAPADVHLVLAGNKDDVRETTESAAAALDRAGLRILLDDRTVSTGVKFADAELLGAPTVVVFGRGLANGEVELRDRRTGERSDVPLVELESWLRDQWAAS
jgi:prolyl-tRNA synthetase